MKTIILAGALVCASICALDARADAPSPLGFWARGDGIAKVKIEACGTDLCAINTWIRPGTKDEKVSDKLVMSVKPTGPATWSGKAFDPQRHLNYRLTMTMMGQNNMTTKGCILGGLICKNVAWTRLQSSD